MVLIVYIFGGQRVDRVVMIVDSYTKCSTAFNTTSLIAEENGGVSSVPHLPVYRQ